jgi:phosphoribosylaminoimidazolecarboxamide formyltransferase/IMP cyclohydrolase
MGDKEITLRYGCNPHQKPARVYAKAGALPLKVLNGAPGYINLLDALNAWQLVRELKQALGLPAAASFKHVSPAGAAVGNPLSDTLKKAYFVEDMSLSPLATAYARARGADRMSSFGDWIALSDPLDVPTAKLIRREVSDGVIAPGCDPEALEILRQKRNGKYTVVEIDPDYEPTELETRDVFGITFEQKRNDARISDDMLNNIVTQDKAIPEAACRDLIVALVALKYIQSNSVCLALDGQVVGVGAGQQSRVHCVRLAASKADVWYLRQHPAVLGLKFKAGLPRPERDNAIDVYLRDDLTSAEEQAWQEAFEAVPKRLSPQEKRAWLDGLKDVALASDAFFPFRDNIDRARQSGVRYIAEPGGSVRDDAVIAACDEYGMVMAFSGVRLFHH